jgi:hypothetical protein
MDMNPTPSWQQLIDWIEGRLSPVDAARIEKQVANAGAETVADVAWIRAFVRAHDEIILDEPPAELRSALRTSFDTYASKKAAEEDVDESPNLLQRLVAALTFDSGLQPGLAGARAGETEGVRQLIYSTDAFELSLSLQPGPVGVRVDGQILPLMDLNLDAFHVRIEQDSQLVIDAPVDAYGIFSFEAVRPDIYQLVVHGEELNVRIELLDLRG